MTFFLLHDLKIRSKDNKTKKGDAYPKAQDIYFDLEEFQENDTANAAQKKTIELMDEIASIRKRILQGDHANE